MKRDMPKLTTSISVLDIHGTQDRVSRRKSSSFRLHGKQHNPFESMTNVYTEEVCKYLYGKTIKHEDQFDDFLLHVRCKCISLEQYIYHLAAPKIALSQVYAMRCLHQVEERINDFDGFAKLINSIKLKVNDTYIDGLENWDKAHALCLLVNETATCYEYRVTGLTMEDGAYDVINDLKKRLEKLKEEVKKEFYLTEMADWVHKFKFERKAKDIDDKVAATRIQKLKAIRRAFTRLDNWPEEVEGFYIKNNKINIDILSGTKRLCYEFLESNWADVKNKFSVTIPQVVKLKEQSSLSEFAVFRGGAIFNVEDKNHAKRILVDTNIRCVATLKKHANLPSGHGTIGCVVESSTTRASKETRQETSAGARAETSTGTSAEASTEISAEVSTGTSAEVSTRASVEASTGASAEASPAINQLYVITARHVFETTETPSPRIDPKSGNNGNYMSLDDDDPESDDDQEEQEPVVTKISNSSFGILNQCNDKAVDIALVPIVKHEEACISDRDDVPTIYTEESDALLDKEVEMSGATSDHRTGVIVETDYTMQISRKMCDDCLLVISNHRRLEHFAQRGDSGALVLWKQQDNTFAIGLISKVKKQHEWKGEQKSATVVVRLDNCLSAIEQHYQTGRLQLCGFWDGVDVLAIPH